MKCAHCNEERSAGSFPCGHFAKCTECHARDCDRATPFFRWRSPFTAFIAAVAFACCALLALVWVAGCGAGVPTPAQQARVGSDALDQTACVYGPEAGIGKAEMRREIDACKNAVRARRDGGAE